MPFKSKFENAFFCVKPPTSSEKADQKVTLPASQSFSDRWTDGGRQFKLFLLKQCPGNVVGARDSYRIIRTQTHT